MDQSPAQPTLTATFQAGKHQLERLLSGTLAQARGDGRQRMVLIEQNSSSRLRFSLVLKGVELRMSRNAEGFLQRSNALNLAILERNHQGLV